MQLHRLVLVLALAGCGKQASSLVETKLGDTGMLINLPAGATVKAETKTMFTIDRGSEPLGLINDSGTTEWPDASWVKQCDLGDPKPFETANLRGVTCGKDGTFRTLAYIKVYNAATKNIQSCNIDSRSAGEGEEICGTLSGPRENH